MRLKSHTLAVTAVLTAVAVSPAIALADAGWDSPTHRAGATICYRDYSRNSVDGGYCVAAPATARVGLTSVQNAASPKVAVAPAKADGFSWGDAGVGAGAGATLAVVTLGGAALLIGRRRHEGASPVAGRSATTG